MATQTLSPALQMVVGLDSPMAEQARPHHPKAVMSQSAPANSPEHQCPERRSCRQPREVAGRRRVPR